MIRWLDRQAGITLRRLANLITGNSFARIQKEVRGIKKSIEASEQLTQRIHDGQQEAILLAFKATIGSKA